MYVGHSTTLFTYKGISKYSTYAKIQDPQRVVVEGTATKRSITQRLCHLT
jgi:hypothetical protein